MREKAKMKRGSRLCLRPWEIMTRGPPIRTQLDTVFPVRREGEGWVDESVKRERVRVGWVRV